MTRTAKEIHDHPAVKAAQAKYDGAKGSESEKAREVELEAAKIEAEFPAMGTAEATARAKAKVGHADPFNTVREGPQG
jgi:hypothetical protein